MSGWEEIDSDSSDHFAVVFGEDYSIQPDAIFRSREDADAYVAWQLSLPRHALTKALDAAEAAASEASVTREEGK